VVKTKPLDLRPEVARAFVEDMPAFFADEKRRNVGNPWFKRGACTGPRWTSSGRLRSL